MTDTDSNLQNELDGLKYEIQVAKGRLPDYAKRHFNAQREKTLIYCLRRAVELSEGCVLCAQTKLLAPQYLLTRGLLESLIWVCWIAKSNENAQAYYYDITKNELKRLARINLETGYGRVINTTTNEDVTQELLHSDWKKDIHTRLRIVDVAKDAGLDKLYREMYGFMSIPAHGNMLETNSSLEDDMGAILAVANVLMESINLVLKNWIDNRKQTPIKDIYSILQITPG